MGKRKATTSGSDKTLRSSDTAPSYTSSDFQVGSIAVVSQPRSSLLESLESQFSTLTSLPTERGERKAIPLYSGLFAYFPNALAAVAACSHAGNEQHNPGQPLHWDRSKSQDHPDCLLRHLMEAGTMDKDGIPHSAKVAWRALAMLQLELEKK